MFLLSDQETKCAMAVCSCILGDLTHCGPVILHILVSCVWYGATYT